MSVQHRINTWSNTDLLWIGFFKTNFSEISIKIPNLAWYEWLFQPQYVTNQSQMKKYMERNMHKWHKWQNRRIQILYCLSYKNSIWSKLTCNKAKELKNTHTALHLDITMINGLVQDYIANALEILQSCIKPSICLAFLLLLPWWQISKQNSGIESNIWNPLERLMLSDKLCEAQFISQFHQRKLTSQTFWLMLLIQ